MCAKSRKSSPTQKGRKADRPFVSEVLSRARAIAAQYQIIVQAEDGEWYGRGLEMPHVFGDGATVDACVKRTREALTVAVAYLLESGLPVPASATEKRRNEQVNVRLTTEEKLLLEASAKRKGYSGLSDFIRAAAVEATTR